MKHSVLVPAFNAKDTLLRCINSIADARKEHAVDLLIIDDGSTDSTRTIAEILAQKYPWVSILSQTNGGESAARNQRLCNAQGRYICFVDADDTISDKYFDFLDEKLASTDADVLIFGVNRVMLDGESIERPNIRADLGPTDIAQKQLQATKNRNIYWHTCARVFSREIMSGLCFAKDVKMGEDVIFNIVCLNRARRASVFPDCLYDYYENLISPIPQPPVAGFAPPAAQHGAT